MQTVAQCPLCAARELHTFLTAVDHTVSHQPFEIRRCGTCGFCFTSPRPEPAEIGAYYQSADYISHSNTSASLQDKLYQRVRRRALRGKHKLIHHYTSHGAVLDLGCGTGEFLGYLKQRGYKTQGIEPSALARAQAEQRHGLVVSASLEELAPSPMFDVITLWHVLEHVYDVRHTLHELHRRAVPGALLVIAVPDRESWDAQHYRADWAAYDVPRHLSHFRRQDLKRFLEESGFVLLNMRPMWFDAPYVSMLSERHRGAGAAGALLKGALWGTLSNLIAATTPRPTSSTLYVCRKA